MRTLIFILLLLFKVCSLCGQTRYHINYDKPYKLRINSETKIGKDSFYDVDFINSNNQVIKSILKVAEENHNNKKGYDIQQTIAYYFFSDTSETCISIDQKEEVLYKTVHKLQNGKDVGWVGYSVKPKISKDGFRTIIAKDIFLNHPDKFPATNLTVETKMVKRYENDKLVYKCYYERFGNLKTAMPAREQFFKYNDKGLIIEHISNPKSNAGGTAFMRQTFEYNDKNQLIKREWYENGKHQCTDDFEYSDKTIVEHQKFYNIYGNGNPEKFSVMNKVYKIDSDGLYYSNDFFRTKFSICNDLD